MEAKLEQLQAAMMSVIWCEQAGDLMSLPRNESRLMDAAMACGASFEEPCYLTWAAMRVTGLAGVVVRVHPDKTAARAVDACGGTSPASGTDYGDGWTQGYDDALVDAMRAVGPVDALMSDLLEALTDLLSEAFRTDIDLPALEAARAAIAKATDV